VEIPVRRARPEQTIQAAVCEHLRLRAQTNVYWFHPANGGLRSKTEARIFVGLGVTPGTPDIFAIHEGRTFALELKAPAGRLTAVQKAAHEALRAAGAEVATCWGIDAAIKQLEDWHLLRGRVQ
jgi:hypothetical protein